MNGQVGVLLRSLRLGLVALGVSGALTSVFAQTVTVVQTTGDQSQLLAAQPSLQFVNGAATAQAITVNDTIRYQRLEGVGATFNDSGAYLVQHALAAPQRAALMQDLFSPGGIHLNFLRQPMGATDLALSSYTYDDLAPGQTDPGMQQFSVAHDEAYLLPTLREALAANPRMKVLALPWSPPAWMKTTGTLNGGTLAPANFPAYALYFSRFVQAYEAAGVPINYVAVQNEPLNENGGYPTMFMNPVDEGTFVARHLGPALRGLRLRNRGWNFDSQNADRTDATPGILGYEHNWDNPKYPETLAENPAVRPWLAGVSFHCYAGNAADAQNALHDLDGSVPVYFTECTGGTYAPNFAANLVYDTQNEVIDVLRNWGKSVVFWNMALDQNSGPTVEHGCSNCRGVVTIDTSATPATVVKNVEYYVLGQLAKFVQAGAYRVDSNSFGSGNVQDVAFKNPDGSVAVLVLNGANTPSTFSLNWRGKTASYTMPAGAVATLTWNAEQGSSFDLLAGPGSQTVAPDGYTTFDLDVERYAADARGGPVRLKLSGLPSGTFGTILTSPFDERSLVPVVASGAAPAGTYPLTITGRSGDQEKTTTVQLTVGGKELPYGSTPAALPGTVQAENFDEGGNFVGYFNQDPRDYGSAPQYRPGTTVGVEQAGDAGGGYDVGYTKEGEYLRYTVDVAKAGLYNLQSRVASLGQGGYYHVSFDGENKTGTLFVPVTNGFQNYVTAVSPSFNLAAGRHVMQVTLDGNGPSGGMGNFNWFAAQMPVASTGYPSGAATIPGTVEVENFDAGGKGAAYWNGATQNGGGANYRPGETVYIESCSDAGGGFDVGNTTPGDWLNYSVDIAATRAYTLGVRVANGVGGGVFHLAVDGQRVTPFLSVPETGGYQTWQTLTVPGISLPQGRHTLQLVIDSGGFYNAAGNFNSFTLQ